MLSKLKYIIVEDRDQERVETENIAVEEGFDGENRIDWAGSYASAKESIQKNASLVDVIFLDLNLPESDARLDLNRDHGYKLLRWIHEDLNRKRPANPIRVVIVSGQHTLDGILDEDFRKKYSETLVAIAFKAELPESLRAAVRAVAEDGMLEKLRKAELNVRREYRKIIGPGVAVRDKLQAAKLIACRLLEFEGDYWQRSIGSFKLGDDLKRGIETVIKIRFRDGWVQKNKMIRAEDWGHFLWRGTMIEHLYGVNNYRNRNEHMAAHDYRSENPADDGWNVPQDVLDRYMNGDDAVGIVKMQIDALLNWYLPWHEQVYIPWARTQKKEATV